jgi:hypothetical protein
MIVATPTKLAMLCRVLNEAYAEAKKYSPSLWDADDQGLKMELACLILHAFGEGETEPRMLKRIALVRFARGKSRFAREESRVLH